MKETNIFFDTMSFVYLIQKHDIFYDKIAKYIATALQNEAKLTTSAITITEFCVKPEKIKRQDIISDFKNMLNILEFEVVSINTKIAEIASKIMAKYDFLKIIDAIQISTAIYYSCDIFVTNDKKLSRITELKIQIIEIL